MEDKLMKKTLAILGALLALAACSKQPLAPEQNQDFFKVNITVNRADGFASTKASVKEGWANGDVVFLFFAGVEAPKYMELKYSGGSWQASAKNELKMSDLENATTKKVTAVFLPYANNASVGEDEDGNFIFTKDGKNINYSAWYLTDAKLYTLTDGVIECALDMHFSDLVTNAFGYRLVQFDVSDIPVGSDFSLYQEHLKSLTIQHFQPGEDIVGAHIHVGDLGKAIPGYIDDDVLFFSAYLDSEAVGEELDYQFSILDEAGSVLYTRDARRKTISENSAIDLGDLRDSDTWNATEYVDLGIANEAGQRVMWAKMNLGATVEKGEGCYGNYYAWMKTKGYSLSGSYGAYTCDHTFDATNYALDPDGDPATAELKGLWRVPTLDEFKALSENATRTPGGTGILLGTSFTGKGSYAGASIFLPAAGNIYNSNTLDGSGQTGVYWSSTEKTNDDKDNAYNLYFVYIYVSEDFSVDSFGYDGASVFSVGQSIRPVFSID